MMAGRFYCEWRARRPHESDLLRTLCETLEIDGWRKSETADSADLSVVWGWDRLVEGQPTVFVERGWLPRWLYQVSPRGLNAESHVAEASRRSTKSERSKASVALELLRTTPCTSYPRDFAYADPAIEPARELPAEFVLAPLQVETDPNLRSRINCRFEDFVLTVTLSDPPFPIVFKRHPALAASRRPVTTLRRDDVVLDHDDAVNVHSVLKHPGCKAVVTLNSNVAHDALIWDVPVVALARGPWPEDGPFWTTSPASWDGFLRYAAADGMRKARLDYTAHLLREQWTVERAEDVDEVRSLVEAARREVSR